MDELANTNTAGILDPPDLILAALQSTVNGIPHSPVDVDRVSQELASQLDAFLPALLPAIPSAHPEDSCDTPAPDIVPFCAARKLALATSALSFDSARANSAAGLRTAFNAWELAQQQYAHALTVADIELRAAVNAAAAAFAEKENSDSKSRQLFLYFNMKATVAAALQAFETSKNAAGSSLAAATAAYIAAYVEYLSAIGSAQAATQVSDAATESTFWQSVEALRDQS